MKPKYFLHIIIIASIWLFMSGCTELYDLRNIKEIQDAKIRELMAENEQYQDKYYKAIEERNATVNQLNKSIVEQNTLIATLEKARSDREAELELKINKVNLELKDSKNEIARLNQVNTQSQMTISEKDKELNTLKTEKDTLATTVTEKDTAITSLNSEIETYKNEIVTLNETISKLNASIQQNEEALKKAQEESKQLSGNLTNAKKDYEKRLSQLPVKPATDLSPLKQKFEKYLQDKAINFITIEDTQRGLVISVPASSLFEGFAEDIKPDMIPILKDIAQILKESPDNDILIEGHTDNQPIKDSPFFDNLHLSSSRSLRITRFLINDCGIKSSRLYAVSAGEFHPKAENNTPEGRNKNRRVDIVVLK